jgi:nitrogen fixation NifU-like protein
MEYSSEVMKNFLHPKNMGEMKKFDGVGKIGNPICGDVMEIFIKVEKNQNGEEILKDIKFRTFGCIAAIATSSMITQLAKNKTLDEASKITRNNVADSLRGLPPVKMHCSNLASEALLKAIENYKNNKKQ